MENEISIIKCKGCAKEVKRVCIGRYPNGRDKKWVDEDGRQLMGRKCPDCHSSSVAKRSRNKRVLGDYNEPQE